MKEQGYLKGALIISLGGFVSKLLGAFYRIPLISILGGKGMGIYQMVYPLYCILLTVSASGIPTGIARLISADGTSRAEKTAFRLYGAIGLVGAIVMFALSDVLAAAQGEPSVALCCKILSPSVFFVSIISVVRGYFQGRGNMYPTALTEISEQFIKVGVGIILAYVFRADVTRAVAAAVAAVTISEVACTLISWAIYRHNIKKQPPISSKPVRARAVLKYTLPLTFTAIAPPVSQLVESIVIVNLLRASTADATALYGIYSGCAITLIGLPVSLSYGLAAASIPRISPLAASGQTESAKQMAWKATGLTLLLSLPCAVLLFAFAPLAAHIIFSSLSAEEGTLLVRLVRIMAINAVTASLVQTTSACLTSLGKPLAGTLSQWVSSALRVGLSALLVAFTPLGVSGAAVAANSAYLVALILNLCYIIAVKQAGRQKDVGNLSGIGSKGRAVDPFGKSGA